MDLEKLVKEFALQVAAQTEAMARDDVRTANMHANKYIAIFKKLRAQGNVGRDALTPLLKHDRVDVRTTAAAFLLRHRTAEARAVLEEAALGKGLEAFEASEALKRWDEGTWALDPAEEEQGRVASTPPNPRKKGRKPV